MADRGGKCPIGRHKFGAGYLLRGGVESIGEGPRQLVNGRRSLVLVRGPGRYLLDVATLGLRQTIEYLRQRGFPALTELPRRLNVPSSSVGLHGTRKSKKLAH